MRPRRPRDDRKGLALVPALVCLLLVSLLCGAMLKLAHTQRGAVRAEEGRAQAEWLAESGAARASARLSKDDGYQGETWDVPASSLGGRSPAKVTIVVEAEKSREGRRRVRVEADYPANGPLRARRTKHLTVDLRPETPRGPS